MSLLPFPPTTTSEAIELFRQDVDILHEIVHGDANAQALTDNGLIPSVDNVIQDILTRVGAGTAADILLRDNLAAADSSVLVGGETAGKVGDVVDKFTLAADSRLQIPVITVGNEVLAGATLRDAVVVGRNMVGLTNSHGFADRTIISGVTDSGTYGVYDSTVRVDGSHTQDHVYSFQDRTQYNGTGTLSNLSGLYSAPSVSGNGTITQRNGVEVRDITNTGGATISANIGVFIRNLAAGASNVGLNIQQVNGYSIFASGGAKGYISGQFGVGVDNTDNVAIAISNSKTAGSVKRLLLDTNANGAVISVAGTGDSQIEVGQNGGTRWVFKNSTALYSIEPAVNNSQDLGTVSKLLRRVYTYQINLLGPIITSGAGTPEGVVTAVVGSMYTRTDGGAGTTLYIKESGAGNTGWIPK